MVVLPENSSIVVALMNETLHGYAKKVKKLMLPYSCWKAEIVI
jgi:hypothetical protein